MAVTFHNATVTAGPASVGTATILHTISAADACLLVYTHANTAISISAMAANGLSLTRLGHCSASSSRAEVWGLTAAPLATLSISVNTVGAASLDFCLVAVSYVGHRQFGGSPFGTVVAGTAQAVANVAFSVSSTSTDLVSYGFGISANTTIAFNTGTSRGNTTHTTTGRLVVGEITGAATISISATAAAAGTWSFLGVPIVASAVFATTIRFDNAAFTAGTAPSFGLLLTATANTSLIVFVGGGDKFQTISSIVIGSTPLTFLGLIADFDGRDMEVWVLSAAPTGILTISATMAGGGSWSTGLGGITYTGTKRPNPFGGFATATAATALGVGLSVSTTAGNVVVFGFSYDFSVGVATAGPGLTQRGLTTSAQWPDILIADVIANAASITGSANATATTQWGAIGVNLIQQGTVSGAAAMTDLRDTLSATGYVLVSGRLSATDAADRLSATGYTIVTGRLSATDVTDRFSASGYVIVAGRMSATDVVDRLSATGYVIVSGRMSATDAPDIFSASGFVVAAAGGNITGRLSATEAADIFSASGYTIISGLMSATDVMGTLSATGYTLVSARLSATDVTDSFSATGYVVVTGRLSATDAPDIFFAPSTAVVVIPTQDTASLGGKKEKKTEYFRADDAFWDARAKYLLSLQPAIASEPDYEPSTIHAELPNTGPSPIDPALLIQYRAARSKIVQALPAASNMRQLKAQGKRLYEINARIAEQKRLQAAYEAEQERARIAKEARQRKRAQDIRRVKRRVILLAATRAAVALTYLLDKL